MQFFSAASASSPGHPDADTRFHNLKLAEEEEMVPMTASKLCATANARVVN